MPKTTTTAEDAGMSAKVPITAEVLKDAVKRAGGIDRLARILDISTSSVWRWYHGKTRMSRQVRRLLETHPFITNSEQVGDARQLELDFS